MKLRNKVALITGASQGIGKGVAEIFAEEGADVAINHLGSCENACAVAAWVKGKGRRSLVVEADVSQREQVEAMFDQVEKELGPVDVLVNNAGIETIVPFLDLTDQQWSDVVNVNLRGEWLCSQVFCRRAVAHKHWLHPGGKGFAGTHPLRAGETSHRSADPQCFRGDGSFGNPSQLHPSRTDRDADGFVGAESS
jgi:NAD(P)-dependent dehydrogenase (short-subunit alcohol dehydrogenase family)